MKASNHIWVVSQAMLNESKGYSLTRAYAASVVNDWALASRAHRRGPPRPRAGKAVSSEPLAPNPSNARLTVTNTKWWNWVMANTRLSTISKINTAADDNPIPIPMAR